MPVPDQLGQQVDDGPRELHIASCIVRTVGSELGAFRNQLAEHPQITLVAQSSAGKSVVLLEGSSTNALLEQLESLRQIPLVVSVEMVYQHAESEAAMKEVLL